MAQFHDSDWWSSEFKRLLEEQQPEDLHLDYKDKRSLLPHTNGGGLNRQKRADDVSKDVSSFLNSDGGVLVYGVPETDDPNATGGTPAAPIPVDSCDPDKIGFERGEITKETIEHLITDNIQPKPGPELFQIVEVEHEGRIVFIVEIAVGVGDVWQAKDKKYYRRSHYKSEPMEHYEINMVRDRDVAPNLKLVFGLDEYWNKERRKSGDGNNYTIHIGIQNDTNSVAEAALVELWIRGFGKFGGETSAHDVTARQPLRQFQYIGYRHVRAYSGGLRMDLYELSWPFDGLCRPIFRKVDPVHISEFDFVTGEEQHHIGQLIWRIQAPGMKPKNRWSESNG